MFRFFSSGTPLNEDKRLIDLIVNDLEFVN
jgi:hypothetical protein